MISFVRRPLTETNVGVSTLLGQGGGSFRKENEKRKEKREESADFMVSLTVDSTRAEVLISLRRY